VKDDFKTVIDSKISKMKNIVTEARTFKKQPKKSKIDTSKIKEGSLHTVLGLPKDKKISEIGTYEILEKCKQAVRSGKVTYKKLVGKLTFARVMNKRKHPEIAKKYEEVSKKLKEWWAEEKKRQNK